MPQVFDDIIVDAEFAALIPPLTPDERQQLEENIKAHGGARDPIVVWPSKGKMTLIDGHNRYEICTRLDVPFEIEEVRFDDRNAAMLWIIDNQKGRRNLPDFAKTELELKRESIHAAMTAPSHRPKKSETTQKSEELSGHAHAGVGQTLGAGAQISLGVSRPCGRGADERTDLSQKSEKSHAHAGVGQAADQGVTFTGLKADDIGMTRATPPHDAERKPGHFVLLSAPPRDDSDHVSLVDPTFRR